MCTNYYMWRSYTPQLKAILWPVPEVSDNRLMALVHRLRIKVGRGKECGSWIGLQSSSYEEEGYLKDYANPQMSYNVEN